MTEGTFNRQNRRLGGERPLKFFTPNLSQEDSEILKQEAVVREQFGKEDVRLFWEQLPISDKNV